jgi:hypothetical protein
MSNEHRALTSARPTLTVLLLLMVGLAGAADSRPVLWRDPGNIASKDLFWGPGSAASAPKAPFTFLEEDSSGTKPKIRVRDARNAQWNVKFRVDDPQGDEVQAEVAASRIVWALGYFAEEAYFLPEGRIRGITTLRRTSRYLRPDGEFREARFEKRPPSIRRSDTTWSFAANPFLNTKELSGLKLLMALLSNWDNHDSNNKIFTISRAGGAPQEWFVVADWGSSFGRLGRPGYFSNRSRWNLKDYQQQRFIDGRRNGDLLLHYEGAVRSIETVPLDHARWFSALASQLRLEQLRRAFEAAGAAPEERKGFSERLIEKIHELQQATNSSAIVGYCQPWRAGLLSAPSG